MGKVIAQLEVSQQASLANFEEISRRFGGLCLRNLIDDPENRHPELKAHHRIEVRAYLGSRARTSGRILKEKVDLLEEQVRPSGKRLITFNSDNTHSLGIYKFLIRQEGVEVKIQWGNGSPGN